MRTHSVKSHKARKIIIMKALLLENPHSDADKILEAGGLEVIRYSGALEGQELTDALQGVSVVGIRSKSLLTKEVIEQCPNLEVVAAYCIGTNQIDLLQCNKQGVAVFNAPYSNTRSVIELAIGEIICITRDLPDKSRDLHNGVWNKSATGAHEVRGRTLGIVGYGNIGTQLSVVAEALGMSVQYYDVAERLALGNARKVGSLKEIFETSDVISIHVDGRPSNAGMIGQRELEWIKPGCIFINLSRGFVVDTSAIREKILDGTIAGAAVDVFPTEPKKNGDPFQSELCGLPNVFLSPHVGGSTEEAQADIGVFVSNKIVNYLSTGNTNMSVNFPNLNLPPRPSANLRLAWVHENLPGSLAKINQLLADHHANIEAQTLGTVGEIGYLLADVAGEITADTLHDLESFNRTIRVRIMPLS